MPFRTGDRVRLGTRNSPEHNMRIKLSLIGKTHGNKNLIPNNRLGSKLTVEHKEKISIALKGNKNGIGNKSNTGKKLSIEQRKKMSFEHVGDDYVGWSEEISITRHKGYHTKQYNDWRKAVFERDNFTCQSCKKEDIYLETHHIKLFSQHPELRYVVDNGITLCSECHRKLHKLKPRGG